MNLDFSRCRLPPFQHQREDVAWLIERPQAFLGSDKVAFIGSQMRTGKTKIVIDAAQFLAMAGVIDKILVVAPAPVRDVWFSQKLGEIAKHSWHGLGAKVIEFHAKIRMWEWEDGKSLQWLVTNYEFLRSKARLQQLMSFCGPKTWLVLDESSFVKNHAAAQTRATMALRKACGRVTLLNGTPIFHSPLDLFSQGNLLHTAVLNCPFITQFKARYAVQQPILSRGGKALTVTVGKGPYTKEIVLQETVGWVNLDDLQKRFAPVTVRRLQAECRGMPPKLDPVTLTATMTPETWKIYKDMREEFMVWLKSGEVVTSATAAVKTLRLSQITGGFLTGAEAANIDPIEDGLLESLGLEPAETMTAIAVKAPPPSGEPVAVGREKLDVLLWFLEQQLVEDANLKIVVWTRFRAELFRMVDEVHQKFPQFEVGAIHGGQKRLDRERVLALLKTRDRSCGAGLRSGDRGHRIIRIRYERSSHVRHRIEWLFTR